LLAASLFATWFIWGSTYLGIKLTLASLPPMLGCGIRYLLAGGLMLLLARWRRETRPTCRETRNALLGGGLALAVGNGAVCLGEVHTPSGVVALVMAATPLFTVLLNRLLGQSARRLEWLGVLLGIVGVALVQQQQLGGGNWLGLVIVLAGALAWAVASVTLPRLQLPAPFFSAAIQMIGGGAISLLFAVPLGEQLRGMPDRGALLALAYLVLAGSLLGYTAYLWLLAHARPALATSFFCVNPLVAVGLGAIWGNEPLHAAMLAGAAIVVVAVAMVVFGGHRASPRGAMSPDTARR
jgi:drug/metabolite transporter (DMT)-like permease